MILNIGVIKTTGIGSAYLATQLVDGYKGLELLDVFSFGDGSLMILSGDLKQMVSLRKTMRTADLVRSVFIADCPSELLRAFYSLNTPELETGIVIFESEFVGDLFSIGKKFIQKGLKVFEFRQYRSPGSKSYLVLTGDVESLESELDDLDRSGQIQLNYVTEVNKTLKDMLLGNQPPSSEQQVNL